MIDVFYGGEDWEVLEENLDVAIERMLEDAIYMEKDVPDELTMTTYNRTVITPEMFELRVIQNFIEGLDEEYGDPYEGTFISDTMKEAEKAFLKAVVGEYGVYICTPVSSESISVLDYLLEHKIYDDDGILNFPRVKKWSEEHPDMVTPVPRYVWKKSE